MRQCSGRAVVVAALSLVVAGCGHGESQEKLEAVKDSRAVLPGFDQMKAKWKGPMRTRSTEKQ
jgi:hypothetical protein